MKGLLQLVQVCGPPLGEFDQDST